MDTFSRNLRARARQLTLPDAEVARRAGLSARRYGHYVTGAREPNLDTLVGISIVLETTPNDLLGFETGETPLAENQTMDERKILRERLNAACAALNTENFRLAIKQIETLLQHQGDQQNSC